MTLTKRRGSCLAFFIVIPHLLRDVLAFRHPDPHRGEGSSDTSLLHCHPLLFPAGILCGFENLVGIGDALGCGRLRVFERVVDFEFLVLA